MKAFSGLFGALMSPTVPYLLVLSYQWDTEIRHLVPQLSVTNFIIKGKDSRSILFGHSKHNIPVLYIFSVKTHPKFFLTSLSFNHNNTVTPSHHHNDTEKLSYSEKYFNSKHLQYYGAVHFSWCQ